MKKISRLRIILLLLTFIFASNIFIISKAYADDTINELEILFESNGENLVNISDFENEITEYGNYAIKLIVKNTSSTDKYLTALQGNWSFGKNELLYDGISNLVKYKYKQGRSEVEVDVYNVQSSNQQAGLIVVKNSDSNIKDEAFKIKAGETKEILEFYVKKKSSENLSNTINLGINFKKIGKMDNTPYTEGTYRVIPFIVKGNDSPNSTLSKVTLSESTTQYSQDGTVGDSTVSLANKIPYAISKKGLIFDVTPTKSSANTISYKVTDVVGNELDKVDGKYSTGSLTTNSSYKIIVTDSLNTPSLVKEYTMNIDIVPPLEDLTSFELAYSIVDKSGKVTFDSNNQAIINVGSSISEISFTVDNKIDARLKYSGNQTSKTTKVLLSTSAVETTKQHTIIVIPEKGDPITYNVTVIKAAKSNNTLIDRIVFNDQTGKFEDTTENVYTYTYNEGSISPQAVSFTIYLSDINASVRVKEDGEAWINAPSKASVIGGSKQSLKKGENIWYDIEVIAEDGTTKATYRLNVLREKSTNTDISSIIENGTPIKLENSVYKHFVSSDVNGSFELIVITKEKATYEIYDNNNNLVAFPVENHSIEKGTHYYKIVVTAQNGNTKKEYSLNIIKQSDKAEIDSIELKNQDNRIIADLSDSTKYTYNSSTKTYIFEYGFSVNKINFDIVTSEGSEITFTSASKLQTGINQNRISGDKTYGISETGVINDDVVFVILSENGEKKQTYTVRFSRKKADSEAGIDNLSINGKNPKMVNTTAVSKTYEKMIFEPSASNDLNISFDKISSDSTYEIFLNNSTKGMDKFISNLDRKTQYVLMIRVTAQDRTTINTISIPVVYADKDNTIINIELDGIQFSFNSSNLKNTINIPYTIEDTIINISTNANFKGDINGKGPTGKLPVGQKTFKVSLTSEAGENGLEYELTFNRKEARTDKYLTSLSLTDMNDKPISIGTFTQTTFGYKVRVNRDITQVKLSALIPNNNGSYLGSNASKEYAINQRVEQVSSTPRTITIMVYDEAGKEQPYTIEIIAQNDDNSFSVVKIGNHEITSGSFNNNLAKISEVFDYSITTLPVEFVLGDDRAIVLSATTNNSKTGTWTLVSGLNEFKFIIVSEYGRKTQTYTVQLERKAASKLNKLASLEIYANNIDLLNNIALTNNFKIRIDRNISDVRIVAKVLTSDKSTIIGRGTPRIEGQYSVYEYTIITTSGAIWPHNIDVKAEDENTEKQNYKIDFISKNAEVALDDIQISNSSFSFSNPKYNLGTFTVNDNQLTVIITKKDEFSRIFYKGTEYGKAEKNATFTVDLEEGINKTFTFDVKTDVLNPSEHSDYKLETYTFTYDKAKASALAELDTLVVVVDGTTYQIPVATGTISYTLELPRSAIGKVANINATAKDFGKVSNSTVTLKEKDNINTIKVTSQNTINSVNYDLKISVRSDKASIVTLKIDGLDTFVFDPSKEITQLAQNVQLLSNKPFVFSALNKGRVRITVTFDDQYATLNINGQKITNQTVHSFDYQLTDSGNPEVFTFSIVSEDTKTNKSYSLGYTRNKALTEKNLTDLTVKVDGVSQDINFNPTTDTYEFKTEREASEIELGAVTNPADLSNVSGAGKYSLIKGKKNEFVIAVTAEDGSNNYYKVIAYPQSDETEIENIEFNRLGKDSNRQTVNYQFYKDATSPFELGIYSFTEKIIIITVAKFDANSILLVDGKDTFNKNEKVISFSYTLKLGKNNIRIGMKSEYDKTTKTILEYQFNYEQVPASDKAILKTLDVSVNGKDITIDADNKAFSAPYDKIINLRVDRKDVGTVVIKSIADLNGTVEKGANFNQGLKIGLNEFTIEILAEDEIARGIYTLNIYVADDDNTISNIEVHGKQVDPVFDKNIFNYSIPTAFDWNINQVMVIVSQNLTTTNVSGKGAQTIVYGDNTLKVKSRSEYRTLINDDTKDLEYEIVVKRNTPFKDTQLEDLYVSLDIYGNDIIKFTAPTEKYQKGGYVYTIQLDKDKQYDAVYINSIVQNDKQKLKNTAGEDLNSQTFIPFMDREIRIIHRFKVVAEDGAEREYTINILQGTTIGTDNSIQSVTLRDFIGTSQYLTGPLAFNKDIKVYNITVGYNVSALQLEVKANDAKAVVSGNGQHNIIGSTASIKFYVTAENGVKGDEYEIIVKRDDASKDADLKDLIIVDDNNNELLSKDNLKFQFDPKIGQYTLMLERSHGKHLLVSAVTKDNKATVSGDLGDVYLKAGQTTDIKIYVVAEDGKTRRTYQVEVTLANTTIELEDLKVDGYDFIDQNGTIVKYDKIIKNYNIGKISSDISIIDILTTLSDSFGTVTGNGLQVVRSGKNTILVVVKAENGQDAKTYTITYEKEAGNGGSNAPKSSDAELKGLIIEGTKDFYDLKYDPANKGVYKVTLSALEDKLFLKADKHQRATVTGAEWHTLQEGDTKLIKVQVTAEDGTLGDVYEIEVTRPKASNDNTLIDFYVEANGIKYPLDVTKTYQEVDVDPTTTEVTFGGTKPQFARMSGDGIHPLTSTTNMFPITVIAQNGDIKTYNVNIKKQNNNANLQSLTVYDEKGNLNTPLLMDPVFTETTTGYVIDLTKEPNILEIRIDAKAYGNATVKGTGVFTLKSGSGKVTDRYLVTVTAEDGKTTKDYVITIEREIVAENSITIEDLTLIGDTSIYLGNDKHQNALNQFTMSQEKYSISVPYALKSVILSVSNKEGATIYGTGSYNLTNKVTTITFYLVSKSGKVTSPTYEITITREDASDDATLKTLTLDGNLVDGFDPAVLNYTKKIVLENYQTIDVKAVANNQFAQVSGNTGIITISRGNNYINIKVTAENGDEKTYRVTLIALSDKNDILDIQVTNQVLTPNAFDKATPVYRLNVPYTTQSISIDVKASDYSVISGNGIKVIAEGENIFYVYATSEFGTQSTVYQVIVTRDAISDDATLKSLTVKENSITGTVIDFKPVFDPSTTNYIINLPAGSTLSTIFIEAEANSQYAVVGGIGYKVLKAAVDGKYQNVFEIVVRSQSGKTLTYTVSVYRDVQLSDMAEYETLELKGSDGVTYLGTDAQSKEVFNKLNYIYEVKVPYNVNSVTLNAKALYGNIYGNETLTFKNGQELTFTSWIVSQSGVETLGRYTIKVVRDIPTTDNTLTNLTIDGVQVPNFDPTKNSYELSIPQGSKNQVILDAATSNNTTVTGLGLKDLKPGKNVFTVNATAQDGTINPYTITINYVSNNAMLDSLEVKGTNEEVFNKDKAVDYLDPNDFDPKLLKQKVIVGKNVRKVQLTGTTQDQAGAKVAGFMTYDFPLKDSSKIVYVEVTSATGDKLVYEIELIRKDKLDGNSDLLSLTVGGRQLAFNPKTYAYDLNVDKDTRSINLSAETFNPNSTIAVRGYSKAEKKNVTLPISDIANGQNVIVLEVTSEDGTQSLYTLTVIKDAPQDFLFLILLIASLLLWIITVLYIVVKRSKEKNKEKNEVIF